MALTIGGVSCTIMVDTGVVEAQPPDGPTARVTFKCAYDERYDLVKALVGTSIASGGVTVRTNPYPYPPSPNLYARSILSVKGIKPRKAADEWLDYVLALVEVEFGITLYQFTLGNPLTGNIDPSGQPWTTTTFSSSFDVIRPPIGAFKYSSGSFAGEPVDEGSFGLVVPTVAISMTRHWMALPPLAETMALTGKVNSATMKFANHIFPVGTLLFASGQSRQVADTLGNVVTDYEYRLIGKAYDWNKVPDPDGAFVTIDTAGTGSGSFPYPYASFASLP